VAYVDDLDCFSSDVRAFSPRQVRQCGRVPVLLQGQLASAEDEAFASPVRASILDLSDGGGFVACPGGFSFGERVRLRIEDMEDSTPVLASIRWCKDEACKRPLHGFGLRFLDIHPGQLRELAARFLGDRSSDGGAEAEPG